MALNQAVSTVVDKDSVCAVYLQGGGRVIDFAVVGGLFPGSVRQLATICEETSCCLKYAYSDNIMIPLCNTYQPDMSVHCLNPPIGTWHEEFGVHELLYGEHYAVFDFEANGSSGHISE